jgi:CheY-like chemotaxis protein
MNIEMKTYRALIVEDAVDVRRALKAALELTLPGFTVADVPSAEEGMLEFFRQSVDLLVTDFLLPGMTGLPSY